MDDILEDYKLDTTFYADHVLHTSYRSDPSLGLRKVAVETDGSSNKSLARVLSVLYVFKVSTRESRER